MECVVVFGYFFHVDGFFIVIVSAFVFFVFFVAFLINFIQFIVDNHFNCFDVIHGFAPFSRVLIIKCVRTLTGGPRTLAAPAAAFGLVCQDDRGIMGQGPRYAAKAS